MARRSRHDPPIPRVVELLRDNFGERNPVPTNAARPYPQQMLEGNWMLIRAALLIAAFATLFPVVAEAKSLYVNNSGSPSCADSTTYAVNSSSSPWCTIGRAAWGSTNPNVPNASQAAQAGDTVNIAAGTYTTTNKGASSGRWEVALNPANSGTSGAPITFRGIGTVNIYLAPGLIGPTIGANSKDHIVWDNVRIDEQTAQGASTPDTGPVVFHVTTGSKILNSTIRGTYRGWGDNYNGIRLEAVNGVHIANNTIYGVTGNWSTNDAGIMMYDTANSLIENNYIHSSHTGIFIKGEHSGDGWPQQNNTVRFNWIENCSLGGITLIYGNGSMIYQNIFKDNVGGVGITDWAGGSANITIANNTFVHSGGAANSSAYVVKGYANLQNVRIYNNIFYGPFYEAVNLGASVAIGDQRIEHNLYYGYQSFGSLNGQQISFATWKNSYNKDNASPAGTTNNPLFVDSTLFKLQAGSPARTIGIDILDLDNNGSTTNIIPAGAYISGNEVIGLTTQPLGSPPLAPPPFLQAPANLR